MNKGFLCKKIVFTVISITAMLFFFACASVDIFPYFSSDEPKNSLPFPEMRLVEEVHSVIIPPFFGDMHGWQGFAHDMFTSAPKVSVIGDRMNTIIPNGTMRELGSLSPEKRTDFLAAIGRSLNADAVLNGVILETGRQYEMILQLISSRNSRILWWQAVDFRFMGGLPRPQDQKSLMKKLLDQLLQNLAKRPKPQPVPVKIEPKTEPPPVPQIKPEPAPIPEKKIPRPKEKLPENLSPM